MKEIKILEYRHQDSIGLNARAADPPVPTIPCIGLNRSNTQTRSLRQVHLDKWATKERQTSSDQQYRERPSGLLTPSLTHGLESVCIVAVITKRNKNSFFQRRFWKRPLKTTIISRFSSKFFEENQRIWRVVLTSTIHSIDIRSAHLPISLLGGTIPGVDAASFTLSPCPSVASGPIKWLDRDSAESPWDRHITSTKSLTSTCRKHQNES